MPPVIYAYDHQSLTLRLVLPVSLAAVALALGGDSLAAHLGLSEDAERNVILGIVIFYVSALVYTMMPPRLSADDWLRADAEGLTRARHGRLRRWRWAEVSDFRLHGLFHPASLVVGRSISFRVPDDDREPRLLALLNRLLFLGHNAAIGNNYLSYTPNMVRALNRYREAALGPGPTPAGGTTTGAGRTFTPAGPAVFRDRKKLAPEGKLRRPLALAFWALLGGLGTVAALYVVREGWPARIEDLAESRTVVVALVGIGMGLVFTVPQVMGADSSSQNLLVMSSGGLQLRRNGQRQHWYWHDISEPELRQAEATAATGGSGATAGFLARHDGRRIYKAPKDGSEPTPVAHFLEDIYDAPPQEILRQMRAWRNAALTLGPEVEHPGAMALTETSVAPGEAMTFRRRWAPAASALGSAGLTVMFVIMSAGAGVMLWSVNAELSRAAALSLVAAVLILSIATPVLTVFIIANGKANHLRLDGPGLTYVRAGWTAAWPWRDLAAFEPRSGKLRWSRKQVPLVAFAVPRDDWFSRFLRWAYGIRSAQPLAVIEDVYDVPLGEIARRLDECRRRAAGGGRLTGP